jgi:SAM-dependent methyltransferase
MCPDKEWFSKWFDSPYYHILYKSRNMDEAEFFLQNVVKKLSLSHNMKLIDLACGKGRHSIFLNSLGFDVTGVDLSVHSIEAAKKQENERLHFEVQDLRKLPYENEFDAALNLFTSFGYFDCDDTNQQVINQAYKILKPGGLILIDFMNVRTVLNKLVPNETKHIEGIDFHISKTTRNDSIYKRIEFNHNGRNYAFHEEVQILTYEDFERLLLNGGFTIEHVYGNYALESFDINNSDRLIITARKHA